MIRRGIDDTKEWSKYGTIVISSTNDKSFNFGHLELHFILLIWIKWMWQDTSTQWMIIISHMLVNTEN